ncbi:MAG: enoyl-CoA hydratase/isomerase family protein [Burkholderiales bacterium]|nr:enoyl-CoA hydratase/isomerase family protein [Burkholderiales bacterium]
MRSKTYHNPLIGAPALPVPRRVAVIGAGAIGPDIGYYIKSALPGISLVLVDVAQQAVDAALARLRGYTEKACARGKMTPAQAAEVLARIEGTTDYDAIKGSDWVIEAATENLPLKQRIMAMIEERVAADAVISSNSSSLPAARMFAQMRHPERAAITHFFAPAWRNPVVEVVDWSGAAPWLVPHLRRVLCETGKLPLASADVPCFMLDRIFDNWCNEAALLLGTGASAAQIDAVAREYVHAGPFFVLNLAHGNPIIIETNTLQADEEGEHYRPAPIFRSVDRWKLGDAPAPDPATAAAIRDRLRGIYLSQAVDILDRGIGDAADLDLGCRVALGFRQGPIELMRSLGEAETQRILARLAAERPGMPQPRRALADYQDFEGHVLVDDLDGVKLITLRRPEAHNALHDGMTDEVLRVIKRFEQDDAVEGFVIVGYGSRAFCAGADIGRFPALLGDADACAQYARDCARLLVHLDAMKKPVVAALNGMVLGGGFELAMRCHGLVALRGAYMQLPEITLGIVPGLGAMVLPYRRWPNAAATFHTMLRGATRLKAEQALELGIVDALADDLPGLIDAAVGTLKALARQERRSLDGPVALPAFSVEPPRGPDGAPLSAEVVTLLERCVRDAAAAEHFADALELGYRAFGASGCTAAAREGINAFGEGRKADFSKTG